MTHEYIIAVGGTVAAATRHPVGGPATAVAWAADRILAVGADVAVWSISRGDSTLLDLAGAAVTALPDDADAALRLLRHRLAGDPAHPDADAIATLLERGGLLSPGSRLEPGSPADLACWGTRPEVGQMELLAIVRAGGFTAGDPHTGPFPPAIAP